jgi:hypothetical protein
LAQPLVFSISIPLMRRASLLLALLALALCAMGTLAAAGSASSLVDSRVDRVAAVIEPSAALPQMTRLVDVDSALDNSDVPSESSLTPARGCKGCFG